MTLTAQELYRRGRAHLNAGKNAAAGRVLAQAAQRTEDADLLARIAGSLAALVIRQGDPDAAEQLCTQALARPGLSPQTSAMLHGQLGLLALERGDLPLAVSFLDQGIDGIGDEREHRTPMLINRSVAHMQSGALAAARADLELAAADYAAAGDDVERAMAVHNAGYVALLEGDLVRALQSMAEARAVMDRASAVNAAICDLDRAEVLRDAGLATEAERTLERVARVFGAHRMRQARGEAEFHLARSQLAHDPAGAARTSALAAAQFRAVASDAWAARAEGVRVRAALAEGVVDRVGRAAPVRARADAAAVASAASALRAGGFASDALAVELSAELAAASAGGGRRRVRVPSSAPLEVRLLAHRVRAARAAAAGRPAEARRHAADGIDELSRWQAAFGSLDLMSSVTMHGLPLLMTGLSSAMLSGRPEALFEWSERARQLGQQVVPVRPSPDPRTAAQLAELRVLRSENPGSEWLASPRAAQLHEEVRHRQWTETGAAGLERRATLAEVQASLGRDTALLSFVWSAGQLRVLVVTADRARIIAVPEWPQLRAMIPALRADLDVSAAVRTGPMAAVVQRSLDERLAALSGALLREAVAAAGTERFVITVPGVLDGMPWGMLPELRGHPFTLAVSATRWVAARADAPAAAAPAAGFVAGPRVARGDEEVAAASSCWATASVLRGADATAAAVTALASRVDVLHVAAHGRHAVDNPLFAGLELADGTLFGYDIDLVPRVPATVVLSACEVGRSTVRWGEEAIGMTRVWLHAGSRCVIAAPVVVADDVACELLGAVHDGLAGGVDPAVALARASERTGLVAPFQAYGSGF